MTDPSVDPRTGLETLSEPECWALIDHTTVGRLAVAIDGQPDIFPVNYTVDRTGDRPSVVIRTAPGTKLAAAVLGRGVAFEVDATDEERHRGWSVVVRGHAREIEKLEEYLDAAELPVEPWAEGTKAHYVRIEPTEVSGRRVGSTPAG